MITYKHFIFNRLAVNAFVVYDETKNAVIIDGAVSKEAELQKITDFVEQESLKINYIISTHGHFDHVCGNADLKAKYNAPILMNEADNDWVKAAKSVAGKYGIKIEDAPFPDKYINEGDIIKFGNSELEIFQVPGHSVGSVIIYSKSIKTVFSGDTLFENSIGRTDFPGGDYDTLISSIKSKIFNLPVETIVFPGHGNSTNIEVELGNNPYFKKP